MSDTQIEWKVGDEALLNGRRVLIIGIYEDMCWLRFLGYHNAYTTDFLKNLEGAPE